MLKKIISTILAIGIMAGTGGIAQAAADIPALRVEGQTITFDEVTGFPYISDNGYTMMPLRACMEFIGCQVVWDSRTQTAITKKDNSEVEVAIGKNAICINNKWFPMDATPIINDGHTFLPLRPVLEAYGYTVAWDAVTRTVLVSRDNRAELTPYTINGGTTGVFLRKQLPFTGFDGVQADVTLPMVSLAGKGDCPYVYFGFDWENDVGNAEGGFQFIEDPDNPGYNKWTVFMRQGNDWRWGDGILLEQGSTHHIEFYSTEGSDKQTDLVIKLDGREIIRKSSFVSDFSAASVKAVTAMAMSRSFDGTNCLSRCVNSKINDLQVSAVGSDQYCSFGNYSSYAEWRPAVGANGMWFGTVECIPSYIHTGEDGSISIYKEP